MRRVYIMILAFVAAFAVCIPVQAQLRYGFRLGGSFAKAKIEHSPSMTPYNRSGFSGGLMLEYQVPTCGVAVDIAALYTRYNSRLSLSPDNSILLDAGRNFVELPLHLKYKFWLPALSGTVSPMVYTGPSLMIKCGGICGRDNAFATRRLQLGWDLGIGIDIINFIQLTAGYRFGLGNAARTMPVYDGQRRTVDPALRTNGWNVAVNLLFDF